MGNESDNIVTDADKKRYEDIKRFLKGESSDLPQKKPNDPIVPISRPYESPL